MQHKMSKGNLNEKPKTSFYQVLENLIVADDVNRADLILYRPCIN